MPLRSWSGILFVMIGSPLYICIASQLITSPLKRVANSTASYGIAISRLIPAVFIMICTFDFPVPVAPMIMTTGSLGAAAAILKARLNIRDIDLSEKRQRHTSRTSKREVHRCTVRRRLANRPQKFVGSVALLVRVNGITLRRAQWLDRLYCVNA